MNSLSRFADPIYSIMRLIIGLMFFCHGAQKILGWFAPQHPAAGAMMMTAGYIEMIGGALIAIGLLTRPAAFLASGLMAVAYFMVHAKGGPIPIVNKGELAVIYSWIFLFIFFYGPGRWSLDSMLFNKSAGV